MSPNIVGFDEREAQLSVREKAAAVLLGQCAGREAVLAYEEQKLATRQARLDEREAKQDARARELDARENRLAAAYHG